MASPDKAFVFVMLAPKTGGRDMGSHLWQVYEQSGLYRNDGSTEPLWTVDWYAFHTIVASDGVHLIRYGNWTSSYDKEAIAFFANGKLLRTYRINQLVDIPILLPHSVSHFDWLKSDAFDDASLEFSLTTYDGNRIVFDARTGEIISSIRPARLIGGPIVAVGFCVVAWLLIRYWRRKSVNGGRLLRSPPI
jgi:hypothetical protein